MQSFWIGFEKQASNTREVATVAVCLGDQILMGKRRDNGKMTTPGGHLEGRETPVQGAVRELYEESGIVAKEKDLKFLTSKTVHLPTGKMLRVHGFKLPLKNKPPTTMKNDPDNEVYRWDWVKSNPFPLHIRENMHVKFKDNVLWKKLGIKNFEKTANWRRDKVNYALNMEGAPKHLSKDQVLKWIDGKDNLNDKEKYSFYEKISKRDDFTMVRCRNQVFTSKYDWFKKGLKSREALKGGLADGRPDSDFPKDQMRMGIKVESEHTSNKAQQKEIAKDHITEDDKYYSNIKKMENE